MSNEDDQENRWVIIKLVGVFIAALVLIEGFEYVRVGLAEGTIGLETVALIAVVIVGLALAWQRFRPSG